MRHVSANKGKGLPSVADVLVDWALTGRSPIGRKVYVRLPRAPLPRQTGGPHRVRKSELHRKRKHKGRTDYDSAEPRG